MTKPGVEKDRSFSVQTVSYQLDFTLLSFCLRRKSSEQLLAVLSLSLIIPESSIVSSQSSLFWLKKPGPFDRSHTEDFLSL